MIYDGTGSVEIGTGQYLMLLGHYGFGTGWYLVLGQYNLVPLGIKCYWVRIGLLCLHILKKNGDLVGGYHSGTNKRTNNEQGKIELLSQWTMGG